MKRCVAIVNPMSRGGRSAKSLPGLQRAIERAVASRYGPVDWQPTAGPSDAARIAREAAITGAAVVLSVGGDGTHNGVVNGLLDDHGSPVCRGTVFGVIHWGTGGDLRKSLGIGPYPEDSCAAIAGDRVHTIDVGRIRYFDRAGGRRSSFFVNIASAGIAGLVDRLVASSALRRLGGSAAFAEATLRSFFLYRNRRLRISLDGATPEKHTVCNLIAANGAYFGGGMKIAPAALLDDGLLDIVCMGDFSVVDFIRYSRRLYDGSHVALDKVWVRRARTLTIDTSDETLLDIDGEPLGMLPAEVSLLPRRLDVFCGAGALLGPGPPDVRPRHPT